MSEKTEQPTPKKLRDARKKGQVASSKDVVSAAMMISVLGFLWGMATIFLHKFEELIALPYRLYQHRLRKSCARNTKRRH